MNRLTYEGRTQSIAEWAKELKVSRQYISALLKERPEVSQEAILAHIDKTNSYKLPRKNAKLYSVKNSTKKERKEIIVYDFVCQYILEHQYAPSMQEIAEGLNLNSLGIASRAIKNLLKEGLLETESDTSHARAFRVSKFKIIDTTSENNEASSLESDFYAD